MAPKQQDVEQPLCIQNPNDPTCTTDTANKESNSQLATGDFRRDDAAALEEGALAGEVDPASGPAATPTSSGAIAGVASAGLGGGGGSSNPTARARDIGDKKSEFDGNPKIFVALPAHAPSWTNLFCNLNIYFAHPKAFTHPRKNRQNRHITSTPRPSPPTPPSTKPPPRSPPTTPPTPFRCRHLA